MDHQLAKLRASDGSWNEFEADWKAQCETFGEDFSQYAIGSIPVLKEVAADDRDDVGIYALRSEEGGFAAVAQVNSTLLPGYDGKVLRVRHMLLSPTLDYGELLLETYSSVLSRMFAQTVNLAFRSMPAEHVKFHLRSPADRQFFSTVLETLKEFDIFSSVAMRGSWLYLSLKFGSAPTEKGAGE